MSKIRKCCAPAPTAARPCRAHRRASADPHAALGEWSRSNYCTSSPSGPSPPRGPSTAQRSFHRLCSRRSSTSSFRELCPSFFLKNPGSQRSAIQLNYQNHNFLCFSLGCVDELSHLFASLPAFHSLILSFSLPRRLPSSNRCCSFELNILSYLSIYSSRLISLPGRSILASSATAVRSPSATRCASNASTAPISIFAGLAR